MSNSNFKAQLGRSGQLSFQDETTRLATIERGQNPYFAGAALPANSPVFFGRTRELHRFRLGLSSENPSCFSLLGERRIGKSSFLNQLYQSLADAPHLVTVFCDAQGLDKVAQQDFFSDLAESIAGAIGFSQDQWPNSYTEFRRFIAYHARHYRFALLIDEFEVMANNAYFNITFFDNLRNLANEPEHHFAYCVSSFHALKDLCHNGAIAGSSFFNIFDVWVLGLLDDQAAWNLILKPNEAAGFAALKQPEAWLKDYGRYPFFIQKALEEQTLSALAGYPADLHRVEMNLRGIMQDLWRSRDKYEVSCLFKVIAGQKVEGYVAEQLERRGLLDQGRLFRQAFAQALPDELVPKDVSPMDYLREIENNGEAALTRANRWLDWIEKAATTAGRIRKVYRDVGSDNSVSDP